MSNDKDKRLKKLEGLAGISAIPAIDACQVYVQGKGSTFAQWQKDKMADLKQRYTGASLAGIVWVEVMSFED